MSLLHVLIVATMQDGNHAFNICGSVPPTQIAHGAAAESGGVRPVTRQYIDDALALTFVQDHNIKAAGRIAKQYLHRPKVQSPFPALVVNREYRMHPDDPN